MCLFSSFFSAVLPDAISNNCTRCDDKQKVIVDTILTKLINEKPQFWDELKGDFDKDGKLTEKYKIRSN